jgi:hypothetical protein
MFDENQQFLQGCLSKQKIFCTYHIFLQNMIWEK